MVPASTIAVHARLGGFCLGLLASLGAFGSGAAAQARETTQPWVPIGDDIRIVSDPGLENELRVSLIDRATRSIDLATYDLRPNDAVTAPLVQALRRAADRGVRVRMMASWTVRVFFDWYNWFGRTLVSPPTRVPIQYIVVGGPEGEDRGFDQLDSVHEKMLIIDGERMLSTGRGLGVAYLHWLDTAFLVRGRLPAEASRIFELVWNEASLRHRPFWRRQNAPPIGPEDFTTERQPALGAEERRTHDALLAWIFSSPTEVPTGRGRVLHLDLLRQLRMLSATPDELDYETRVAHVHDPIVEAVVARLRTAKVARIVMLSAIVHPMLKRALLEAARRPGTSITLFINTHAPRLHLGREPIVPGGIVWGTSVSDLDDLLRGGVTVRAFQIREGRPWIYMHRKLAVIDEAVFFGSHNLNLPSTVAMDELSFEIESPKLAEVVRRLFDEDLAANGEPLDPEWVQKERRRLGGRVYRWFGWRFLGYM